MIRRIGCASDACSPRGRPASPSHRGMGERPWCAPFSGGAGTAPRGIPDSRNGNSPYYATQPHEVNSELPDPSPPMGNRPAPLSALPATHYTPECSPLKTALLVCEHRVRIRLLLERSLLVTTPSALGCIFDPAEHPTQGRSCGKGSPERWAPSNRRESPAIIYRTSS